MSEHTTTTGPNRRQFIVGTAAAALAPAALSLAESTTAAAGPSPAAVPVPVLPLDDIQGNILGGFGTDFQALVALTFPTPTAGRAWLAAVTRSVTSSATVIAAHTGGANSGATSWVNVALTHPGLAALGVSRADLDLFPQDFRGGMRARAPHLGDVDSSDPQRWPAPFQRRSHAVLLLATDTASGLDALVQQHRLLARQMSVKVLWEQRGATRADEPGHEHFGFKDGISQPGVRGVTVPSDPANPEQGLPGQDLLWPGEFVIGHATQAGGTTPITEPGPRSIGGPAWTINGSYLVVRRLAQDVGGFRRFIARVAANQGLSEDLVGAKMVGRYKSGAPLEVTGEQSADPGLVDPDLLADESINDFEYGADPDGLIVPLKSHIRATYPRDANTRDGGESATQTHRILRRGIPYGASLPPGAVEIAPPQYPADRGLLFLCYQSSIRRQFEFIQNRWINDPNFPRPGSGQDPVVAQAPATGSFTLQGGRPDHVALMQRFVITTGGDYFFQPSISALRQLAALTSSVTAQSATRRRRLIG